MATTYTQSDLDALDAQLRAARVRVRNGERQVEYDLERLAKERRRVELALARQAGTRVTRRYLSHGRGY